MLRDRGSGKGASVAAFDVVTFDPPPNLWHRRFGPLAAGSTRTRRRLGRVDMKKSSRGRTASQRQLRVGEEVRHALARILARGELSDPALHDIALTVTEVRVSPDLRNAKAFVVPLGGAGMPAVVKALNRASGYFRGQLGREINLRYTPRLDFEADVSFDEAQHIDALLHRPKVQRDIEGAGDAPPTRGQGTKDAALETATKSDGDVG